MNTRLDDLVREVDERHPPDKAVVFSVSEKYGIVPQMQLFTKPIAINDKSKYRRIQYGDIVYNPYLLWNRAVGVCFDRRGGCVSPAYIVLRPRESDTERFLHYFFRSATLTSTVDAIASGSVTRRRTAPLSEILHLEFDLPILALQKAANSMLAALDDKIELNRQMNETLEAIARAIFKSWFVDAIQDGLPKGWCEGTLDDVAENPRRSVQPNAIEPFMPYISLEHMPRNSIALSEWGHAKELESNKFEFRRGEILFGKLRPYFHKVGVAPLDGVCSTDILVVTPKEPEWFGFVLGHVSSVDFVNYTNAGSTGTKMPRTNWQDMARYEVTLPPKLLATDFIEKIRPLIERIMANIHESHTLATIRDTLLPKLLSGKIHVRETIGVK